MTLNANMTQHVNFFDLKVVMPDENTPTLVTLPIVTQTLVPPPTPTPGPDEPTPLPGEPAATAAPITVDLTRPGKKDADEMRIKVVSSTASSSSSSSSSSYTAGGAGTGGGAQYAQTAYGSYGNSHAATPAPLLVGFMANNTYRALIGLAPLPPAVVHALAELDREFAVDGELTQKGYDRRAQELLAPYTPTAVPPAQAPTSASAGHAFDDEDDTDGNGNGNGNSTAAGLRTLLWVDDEARSSNPDAVVAAAGPRLGADHVGDDNDDDDEASERRRPLVTDVWADYRTDLVRAGLSTFRPRVGPRADPGTLLCACAGQARGRGGRHGPQVAAQPDAPNDGGPCSWHQTRCGALRALVMNVLRARAGRL